MDYGLVSDTRRVGTVLTSFSQAVERYETHMDLCQGTVTFFHNLSSSPLTYVLCFFNIFQTILLKLCSDSFRFISSYFEHARLSFMTVGVYLTMHCDVSQKSCELDLTTFYKRMLRVNIIYSKGKR